MITKIVEIEIEVPDDETSEQVINALSVIFDGNVAELCPEWNPITEMKVLRTIKQSTQPQNESPSEVSNV